MQVTFLYSSVTQTLFRPLLEIYSLPYNSLVAGDKPKLESPKRYFNSRIITDPIV